MIPVPASTRIWLADAIGRHVRISSAIFADTPPMKLQASGTGKTETARLGIYICDERPWQGDASPAACYQSSSDRKGQIGRFVG